MPVLSPTFVPAQAPDTGEEISLQSQNDAQNWMTQAAQRQQIGANVAATQQQTAQQAQQFQALLPALAAKGSADAATSQNALAVSTAQQNARQTAAPMAAQANSDYLGIMGLNPDPMQNVAYSDDPDEMRQQRYEYLSALEAKNVALANVPEQAAVFNMIEQAKKDAFDDNLKHLTANTELQSRKYQSDQLLAARQMTAGASVTNAATRAAATVTASENQAGGRVAAAGVTQGGQMNKAQFQEFSKAAEDYENAALKEPDPDKSAALMAKANAFRAKAGQSAQASGGTQFTPEQIQAELARRGLAKGGAGAPAAGGAPTVTAPALPADLQPGAPETPAGP
jgi:hypothetical protein